MGSLAAGWEASCATSSAQAGEGASGFGRVSVGQVFSQLYITSRTLLRALGKGKSNAGITIKIRSFPESVISILCSWGIGKMQKGLSLIKSLRTLSWE